MTPALKLYLGLKSDEAPFDVLTKLVSDIKALRSDVEDASNLTTLYDLLDSFLRAYDQEFWDEYMFNGPLSDDKNFLTKNVHYFVGQLQEIQQGVSVTNAHYTDIFSRGKPLRGDRKMYSEDMEGYSRNIVSMCAKMVHTVVVDGEYQ